MATFTTVEAYIAQCPPEHQVQLNSLRQYILKTMPKATKEVISYNMPTYKLQKNIIHFALSKAHIGIYPGAGAIAHFQAELKNYKTSKGAWQIPLDKPVPKMLLKKMIQYNIDQLEPHSNNSWEKYGNQWQECDEMMQQLIVKTELEKTIKWGTDVYTYKGKNIVAWGGFKDFFSIWFYNGVFLEDKDRVLVAASDGNTKSLRQWRFTAVQQMNEKKILAYIQESIQTVKDGKELKPAKHKAVKPSGLLKNALTADTALKKAFDALTSGRQKEYILYIGEAKQEKTKNTRLEKIKPMILEGKGLHDKYKR